MHRTRTRGLALLLVVGIVLIGTFMATRQGQEPIDEARAFLSEYRPFSKSALHPSPFGEEETTTLERPAYLREEDARMKKALPSMSGWTFSHTTGHFPYDVTAKVNGISRRDRLIERVPGLSRLFPTRPYTIRIELIAFKETRGDAESNAVIQSKRAWTRAHVFAIGRPLGYDAPIETRTSIELTPTPSGPGRKLGE